jgi:hypothetical protein
MFRPVRSSPLCTRPILWRADATTEAEAASRRSIIDSALPDFERVVEEMGILKPQP